MTENVKPRDRAVCLCGNVRERAFMEQVIAHKAFTVDEAREVTGANTGCGACYENVAALVARAAEEQVVTD